MVCNYEQNNSRYTSQQGYRENQPSVPRLITIILHWYWWYQCTNLNSVFPDANVFVQSISNLVHKFILCPHRSSLHFVKIGSFRVKIRSNLDFAFLASGMYWRHESGNSLGTAEVNFAATYTLIFFAHNCRPVSIDQISVGWEVPSGLAFSQFKMAVRLN